jgi:hypothetical protein
VTGTFGEDRGKTRQFDHRKEAGGAGRGFQQRAIVDLPLIDLSLGGDFLLVCDLARSL